ncbi:hypothetical protein SSX86_020970 [Deinandra increscens subsp. villosa]|uniref:Glyoxal oxidase N-terminal domain-containing protein n=1 Tax=Deinandra increscens subsp. villosa TaxID=3103831 RepID=A0AAP0CNV8_9ASTR
MAGGGPAPPPKQDDQQPHPAKDQLPNVSYCMTSPPPWPEAILLGFQHYIVMLGTTVLIPTTLVPQMGGGNEEKAKMIQTLLFVAGLNTLTQTLFGTRLPAVIGGSYTFVPTTISIILADRYSDIVDPQEKFERIMRGTQGALIVASTLQIVLGFSGLWRNITRLVMNQVTNFILFEYSEFFTSMHFGFSNFRFMSPLSAVPLVALTGFGLYEFGFPLVARCIEIGLPQIVFLLIFSQYIPHLMKGKSHVYDRFAVLFSVVIVWIYAHLLTVAGAYKNTSDKTQLSCRTDRAGIIGAAPWIRVPYPFQWGAPTFDAGEAFAMMAASFVALVESTGAFIAVARYASATPMPASVLSRGIGWQGVGVLLSGIFGTGNGSSVSVENAGLLGLTRVGSRRVVQISAGFMIFFSILGKFGAVFASIPAPIVAALYCLFFAYVGSAGLGFLQFCNLNSFRVKFILGFSIFMGLSIPQYFNEYAAIRSYGPVHTKARWCVVVVRSWFLLQCSIGISDIQLLPTDHVIMYDRIDYGCSNISLPDGKRCNDSREQALKRDCTSQYVEYNVATNVILPLTVLTDVWCSSDPLVFDGSLAQTGGYNDGELVVRVFNNSNQKMAGKRSNSYCFGNGGMPPTTYCRTVDKLSSMVGRGKMASEKTSWLWFLKEASLGTYDISLWVDHISLLETTTKKYSTMSFSTTDHR